MKRALLFAAIAPAAALAQLPTLGTDFTVHVVDEARKPVPQAFVVAREFVNVPQFHGSRTYCERADVAAMTRESHAVRLPGAGLSRLTPGRTHADEAYAYAAGYCVERTTPARAAAYSLSGPSMGMERPEPVKPGSEVWLRAIRAEPNEDRLEYLVGFAQSLVCADWSGRSRDGMARLAQAMLAEADAIARTRYGKLLAERMRAQLVTLARLEAKVDEEPRLAPAALEMRQPFVRDFIIGPANMAVRFPREGEPNQMVVIAAQRGTAYGAAHRATAPGMPARPAIVTQSPPPPAAVETGLVIHCRHGAPSSCDVDERDAQGYTALYSYVGKLDVDAVKLLLDAGANPSASVSLYGVDAADALLRRVVTNPPALGSVDAGKAIAIMDLLAASPKASIRASLAEQLASDPSQWFVKSPESLVLLKEARVRLATLRKRPDPPRACEPVEPEQRVGFEAMPVRLR